MDGRTLWVHHDDVAGPLDEGCIVRAAHPLNDWCLRADDGSEPVETGTLCWRSSKQGRGAPPWRRNCPTCTTSR